VETPPQLMPSNRKTAASAYSTALTGPQNPKHTLKFKKNRKEIPSTKNQIVNPRKTKLIASQSPF